MAHGGQDLVVEEGEYAVVRLSAAAPVPAWVQGEFTAVTRTPNELSLVVEAARVPASGEREVEDGWRLIAVRGPFDFGQIGVLASLAAPLAAAAVPLLAISTFDTDYLLIRTDDLPTASAALRAAGHRITSDS